MAEFQIRKDSLADYRVVDTCALIDGEKLLPGEVIATVIKFAITANNMTYAVSGDMAGFWNFFPPRGGDAQDWGIIPVWGFAKITHSNHSEVPIGEKIFGYFPTSTELKMRPASVGENSLIDEMPHRQALIPIYNQYSRVGGESDYDSARDAERMLLWPLYSTSFCLADALMSNQWYGAEQILVLSASSKTSIGLGYALNEISNSPKFIGLTSARNQQFVKEVNVYDQVHNYDSLAEIDRNNKTVIVDMSGNSELLGNLHQQLGVNMTHTINVGLTHWHQATGSEAIVSEKCELFSAPGHMRRRFEQWGQEEYQRKSSEFVQRGITRSGAWLRFSSKSGLHGLSAIYQDVCDGNLAPDEGQIIDMV